MNYSAIRAISTNTFREAIKAKWLLIFALLFFLIPINIPILFLLSVRYLPPNYLESYLSYLVYLSFPFLPLLALPIGASSVVEERESGALQYLLSNPISKSEFLTGRILGLLAATSAVVILGYSAAAILAYGLSASRYFAVAEVSAVAIFLNLVMVGLSLVISVLSRRKATALGVALFAWFLFTTVSNIGFLSSVLALRFGPLVVLPLAMLNPIEISAVLAGLLTHVSSDQLGIAGFIIVDVLQDMAIPAIVGMLSAWAAILFATCYLVFRHQDV